MNIGSQPQKNVPKPKTRQGTRAFFRKLLSPPTFGDLNKDRIARIQNTILVIMLPIIFVYTVFVPFTNNRRPDSIPIGVGAILTCAFALFMLRRGFLNTVSWILVGLVILIIIQGLVFNNFDALVIVEIAVAFALTGMLFRPSYAMAISVLTVAITGFSLFFKPPPLMEQNNILPMYMGLVVFALLMVLASSTFQRSFAQADRSTKNLAQANQDLQKFMATLEQRVAERTHELQRQALQLQAAADISRITGSELETDQLIQKSVNLVRDRFQLYYVGLFLLDESRSFALLQAGAGDAAGHTLLEMQQKLQVNPDSVIGGCILQKRALVVTAVTAHANTPVLPNTRSELALPLISQGQVIGAINIHSEQETAFNPEYINILQTLADQLANSIEKARLYTQISQRAVELNQARAIADAAKEEAESARAAAEVANDSLAIQVWQATGQTLLNQKMRGEQDIHTLGHNIIQQLCKYINAESGAIYILQEQTLQLVGVYAYKRKWLVQECQVGDGLIGQAVIARETIIHHLPENYIAIGLRQGKLLPKFRMVIPVTYNQQVGGAILLDALTEFTTPQRQFIESIIESIAIAFITARSHARINELLTQTSQQAEELQTREEELRASNEELEAQADALRASIPYKSAIESF